MAQRRRRTGTWVLRDDRLFTLDVFIISGPMTKRFVEKNKVVSMKRRTFRRRDQGEAYGSTETRPAGN